VGTTPERKFITWRGIIRIKAYGKLMERPFWPAEEDLRPLIPSEKRGEVIRNWTIPIVDRNAGLRGRALHGPFI